MTQYSWVDHRPIVVTGTCGNVKQEAVRAGSGRAYSRHATSSLRHHCHISVRLPLRQVGLISALLRSSPYHVFHHRKKKKRFPPPVLGDGVVVFYANDPDSANPSQYSTINQSQNLRSHCGRYSECSWHREGHDLCVPSQLIVPVMLETRENMRFDTRSEVY